MTKIISIHLSNLSGEIMFYLLVGVTTDVEVEMTETVVVESVTVVGGN